MEKVKILIVSQYFWPENFRINDLCSALIQRGHEITVLTGQPNYPDGIVFPEFKTSPHSFTEYKGCKILRVPIIARGRGSNIKLVLNYFSYVASALLCGSWKLRKQFFDVIFVYGPSPVTVCLPAIFFKKFKNAPVVFWVQDLWPETLAAVGVVKSKMFLECIGRLVAFIYNRCDMILGQSRAFYAGIAHYCKDKAKIKYFPNWAENFFKDEVGTKIPDIANCKNTLNVLFAGNLGEAQDFPSIIKAAELLKHKQVKIRFFIVGDGRMFDWLDAEVAKRSLSDYVCLLGRYPLESMPAFYASADVLLAVLKENPVFTKTIPSKIQSYMMAGKPIVTMLSGEGSRIIKEAECGLVANSGDFNGLVGNIIKISKMTESELAVLGSNARAYAEKEFDRDILIDQLESWLSTVSE